MTHTLFVSIYAALLTGIVYLLIERLIDKAQSRPVLVQVTGPIHIAGNGQSLADFAASIAFAIVEGTSRIATAKGVQ